MDRANQVKNSPSQTQEGHEMTTEKKSAFARRLGVSPSYITKLGDEGRLVLEGRLVNVEASLARIDATKDPNRDDVRQRHARSRDQRRLAGVKNRPANALVGQGDGSGPAAQQKPASALAGGSGSDKNGDITAPAADVFRKARTAKMHYEARRAVIRVARLQGRLADMSAIRMSAGNDGASLRAMLENLPDRAAPILAPVRDPAAATAIFGKQLDDIETEWADMLAKHLFAMREANT
jgi:hypothetical protein